MEFLQRRWGLLPLVRVGSRLNLPQRCLLTIQPQWRFNSTVTTSPPVSPNPGAATEIRLRSYQEESIQAVLNFLEQGHKRLGISLATGAGKTVIFTQLIGRIPPRNDKADQTLIIVHRRELVEQAARHCRLAYPDRTVEIEMGNSKASGTADITIASIRSLVSKDRIEKLDPSRFKLVLVDEAHHIVAPSYREALGYFGLNGVSEDSPILVGVSATFSRFDGLKLGAAIDHIVYHKDYIDMIDEKWLADAVFTTVKSQADLSKVNKDKTGDFAVGSLSRAVNTEKTNDITVRAWLANARGRKSTLVFCVDVEHTRQLTAAFRANGIDARYITSATAKETRAEQLRAFKNQEYPVLLNCGLFTEGTDIPNIDCVVLARPTRSKNLLIQMIGRGLRLYPEKKDCHIIDMVASLQTGVLSTPTLFGLHPDEILEQVDGKELRNRQGAGTVGRPPGVESAFDENEDVNVTFTRYDSVFDLLGDTKTEQHIRSMSPNAWVRVGPDRYILSEQTGFMTIEKDASGMFSVRYVMKYKDRVKDETRLTRPRTVASAADLETAVRAADTFATSTFDARYIAAWQPWRKAPATAAQIEMLNRAKVRQEQIQPGEISKGQAADMITKLKFGGKKQFALNEAKKRSDGRQQAKKLEFEELQRRTEVKVGPLEA